MTRQSINEAFAALIHPGQKVPFTRCAPIWARHLLDEIVDSPRGVFRHIAIEAPPRYSQRFWSVGAMLALVIGGDKHGAQYGLYAPTIVWAKGWLNVAKDILGGYEPEATEKVGLVYRKDRGFLLNRATRAAFRPAALRNMSEVGFKGVIIADPEAVELFRALPDTHRPRFVIEPRIYEITAENHTEVVRGHTRRVRIDTHDHAADGEITTRRFEVFA